MKFLSLASGALLAAILVLNACQPKNKQMWLDDNHTRPKTPCVKNTDSSPDFSYALCKVGPSVVGVEAYYVPEAREDFSAPQSNVSDLSPAAILVYLRFALDELKLKYLLNLLDLQFFAD